MENQKGKIGQENHEKKKNTGEYGIALSYIKTY